MFSFKQVLKKTNPQNKYIIPKIGKAQKDTDY